MKRDPGDKGDPGHEREPKVPPPLDEDAARGPYYFPGREKGCLGVLVIAWTLVWEVVALVR